MKTNSEKFDSELDSAVPLLATEPNCDTGWSPSWRASVGIAIAILIVGASLRLVASFNEFWLDEVWSWQLAQLANSPTDIVTKIRHDNNHFLNTLVFYLLGSDHHWLIYRLPVVVLGVCTIAVAGAIHWKRDRLESLILMLLLSSNFLMIRFSSEARGYGYLLFFSALSVFLADRSIKTRRVWGDLAFAVTAVLGLAAHATFIFCLMAIVIWILWRWMAEKERVEGRLGTLVRCFTAPLAFGAWIYWYNLSQMQIGGGEGSGLFNAASSIMSQAFGGSFASTWLAQATAVLAFVVLCFGLSGIWARQKKWAMLYGAAILFAPALVIVVMRPGLIYGRYFLVPAFFMLFVVANVLTNIARQKPYGVALCTIAVCLLTVGNAIQTSELISFGRGHYCDVLQVMLDSNADQISVASDYDGRHEAMLGFYNRRVESEIGIDSSPRVRYFKKDELPVAGTDWYLVHAIGDYKPPLQTMTDSNRNRYDLSKSYRSSKMAGWSLFLYRNVKQKTPAPFVAD